MTVFYLLIVLAIAAGSAHFAVRWLRARRRRRQAEGEHVARQQRIDNLDELISTGERDKHFDRDVATRLRAAVADLRTESLRQA